MLVGHTHTRICPPTRVNWKILGEFSFCFSKYVFYFILTCCWYRTYIVVSVCFYISFLCLLYCDPCSMWNLNTHAIFGLHDQYILVAHLLVMKKYRQKETKNKGVASDLNGLPALWGKPKLPSWNHSHVISLFKSNRTFDLQFVNLIIKMCWNQA